MSTETWKAEFYPVRAFEVADLEQACLHSLRKWEGLRPENLARHGVRHTTNSKLLSDADESEPSFPINDTTCALCKVAEALCAEDDRCECDQCPLAQVRGGVACDKERWDEEESPWPPRTGRPEVMIMWLERALQYVKGEIPPIPDEEGF